MNAKKNQSPKGTLYNNDGCSPSIGQQNTNQSPKGTPYNSGGYHPSRQEKTNQ